MPWLVEFHVAFEAEFDQLHEHVQDEILALLGLLRAFGPTLSRPRVATLKGSRHADLKELRFNAADGVWRVAFAFDPERKAILLIAGDKSGKGERKFYSDLIARADARLDEHLARLRSTKRH